MWSAKRAPVWAILLVIAVQYPLTAFFNLVMFHQHWLHLVSRATDGLIGGTIIAYALMLPIVLGGIILLPARLRTSDVGLRKKDIVPAIFWTVAVWAVVGGALAFAQLDHFRFDPSWTKPGAGPTVGAFLAQIFGNALYEEIVYRGFLTVQLMLWLETLGRRRAMWIAVIAAQAIFASIHIPMLLGQGLTWPEIAGIMPELFAAGIALAALYLITGNLLIAVGMHALADAPMLMPSDVSGLGQYFSYAYLAVALVAALGWRWTRPTGSVRSAAS